MTYFLGLCGAVDDDGLATLMLMVSSMVMYNHNQLLMLWALLVQGYDIKIKHKSGTDNVVADALSYE